MIRNRSMPLSTIIPVLDYDDVPEAVAWLVRTFGFVERLRIGDHRAQLGCGSGDLVVTRSDTSTALRAATVMVRVADVDAHCAQSRQAGASVQSDPATFPYGERQYTVVDPRGHVWVFSQSLADVDPDAWGGMLVDAAH